MKKLINRVLGVVVAAALLVGTAMPNVAVMADSHAHHKDENKLEGPSDGYTITLTAPANYKVTEGKDPVFGAYQIFSGKVENEPGDGTPTYTDPGKTGRVIPITDIKWGNAFLPDGTGEANPINYHEGRENIIKFVYHLATAPKMTGDYSSAFKNFHGFDGENESTGLKYKTFAGSDKNTLADRFYVDPAKKIDTSASNVKFDKLAIEVADVISKHSSHEWLQAFTDILGGYGEGYTQGNYVHQCYDKNGKWNSDKYTMKVPAGYYMILDMTDIEDDGTNPNESYSARMMFVAENIQQEIKEDVPKLDKTILREGETAEKDNGYETDVAGVGDIVTYKLTGSLPSNYDYYTLGYKFEFVDTLSNGLTLVNYKDASDVVATDVDVQVTAKGWWKTTSGGTVWDDSSVLPISLDSYGNDPSESHTHIDGNKVKTVYTATKSASENVLTVTFPCLREILVEGNGTIGDADATYRLGVSGEKHSDIYVTYKAKINKDAVVSPASSASQANGNNNTATLTYSNNPQSYTETDKTTPDGATVYTFGLDIIKVDAAQFLRTGASETSGLENAKFVLVRPVKDVDGNVAGWEIAKFSKVVGSLTAPETLPEKFKKHGYYSVEQWETITIPSGDAKDKFDSNWLDSADNAKYKADGYYITSLKEGILNVSGLDVNVTYTMVETATPPSGDYAKIAPFDITLKPAMDTEHTTEYNGKLSNATSDKEVTKGESFSLNQYVEITDPDSSGAEKNNNGSAGMFVANFKYIDLPSTGGIGIYPFYIIGGIVVAGSIILFALSRRKKTA